MIKDMQREFVRDAAKKSGDSVTRNKEMIQREILKVKELQKNHEELIGE